MAKITVTQPGTTVVVSDGDKVFIDIPGGGDVFIVADPNDNVDKFEINFNNDDNLADSVSIDLSTFSENDLHIDIKGYDPSDEINVIGAFNRFVDPNDVDEFTFDYIGADGQTYSGYVHAKDGGEKDFLAEPPPIVICFGKGTEIETIEGPKPVEKLAPGDLVLTLDSGVVPVRWIGHSRLGRPELESWPNLQPVRVRRGAFGAGRPSRDVILSPNHRVLVRGWRAELHFGEPEVLVPVKALIDGDKIRSEAGCEAVDYYHLLLETHQIVYANGLMSESLFLGDQSMRALSQKAASDLRAALTQEQWHALRRLSTVRPAVRASIARCIAA